MFLEATIAEVMRMAATAPLTVDHMATKDSTLGGFKIPKGTIVSYFPIPSMVSPPPKKKIAKT